MKNNLTTLYTDYFNSLYILCFFDKIVEHENILPTGGSPLNHVKIFQNEIIPKYFKLDPTINIKYDTTLYDIRDLNFKLFFDYTSLFKLSSLNINETEILHFINNHKTLIPKINDLYYNITKKIMIFI